MGNSEVCELINELRRNISNLEIKAHTRCDVSLIADVITTMTNLQQQLTASRSRESTLLEQSKKLEDKVERLKLEQSLDKGIIEDKTKLMIQMREGLQELFAMRGEDSLVEKICNPLIEKSRSLY